MKVLIADKFQQSGIDRLSAAGCKVVYEPGTNAEQMPEMIERHGPRILIVRGTKVSGDAINLGEKLSLIVRAGAGYDSIDVVKASQRGIYVSNCPGKNSVAVAELAWGLILACDRRIPDQTSDLREQRWNKKEYSEAKGLMGRTLGIVGTGQIGMEVAKRGRAFGMEVIAWSRSLDAAKAATLEIGCCSDLRDLAERADVISVNVAGNADTKHLIDAAFIAAMRPNAFLINTSRGSVVDQAALAQGIKEKGLRAGLDVFANEPGEGVAKFEDPIVNLPGVFTTHHVGASTDQAQDAIADEAVRLILEYQATGDAQNCVNIAIRTPATWVMTVRHLNLPGVLAHVFQVLGESKINVEEMQNVIYDGAKAACAKIQLDDELKSQHVDRIRELSSILSLDLTRID